MFHIHMCTHTHRYMNSVSLEVSKYLLHVHAHMHIHKELQLYAQEFRIQVDSGRIQVDSGMLYYGILRGRKRQSYRCRHDLVLTCMTCGTQGDIRDAEEPCEDAQDADQDKVTRHSKPSGMAQPATCCGVVMRGALSARGEQLPPGDVRHSRIWSLFTHAFAQC